MPTFRTLPAAEVEQLESAEPPKKRGRPRKNPDAPIVRPITQTVWYADPSKYNNGSCLKLEKSDIQIGRWFYADTVNADDDLCKIVSYDPPHVCYESKVFGAVYSKIDTNFQRNCVKRWVE